MGFRLQVDATVLEYDGDEEYRWQSGDRAGCTDAFCLGLVGSKGFGEYVVDRHFAHLGYEWIHHDFDLFGSKKPNKYPRSEEVLRRYFGEAKLQAIRDSARALHPLREPHKVSD